MYGIKEIYYTIQGEGYHTGQAAVFLRFSGCNLWSGLEKDRATAQCTFCDTDFWGTDGNNGGKYNAKDLASFCKSLWPSNNNSVPYIVCTGGEPLLQLDDELIKALHKEGFFIAIESNGTLPIPAGIDWICISPKLQSELAVTSGHELKLVYPQEGIDLDIYESMNFDHLSLQPMDNENQAANTETCIDICKTRPKWRLSLQTHKYVGIP